jgi:hypothetical protein
MLACTNQNMPSVTHVYVVWWHGTNLCLPRGIQWGPLVSHLVVWWDPHGWGGPIGKCHVAPGCWDGSLWCCHLALLLLLWTIHRLPNGSGLWCGPTRDCHVSSRKLIVFCHVARAVEVDQWNIDTWHKWDPLVRHVGPTWVRWTNGVLTRVTPSLFSDSVYVCLGSPVCTQMCLCPQVAPRWTLDWISALDLSF